MAYSQISSSSSIVQGFNESDSNADTCCLGKNWIVYNYTSRTADVYPYDQAYKPAKDVPIVTGASAYTDSTDTTYILIIHEALFYGNKLDHTLLNPNQLRFNNVNYWDNPYDKNNALSIEVPDVLTIPLQLSGTKISFSSRTPTTMELET